MDEKTNVRKAAISKAQRERPLPTDFVDYEEWVRSDAAKFDPNVDPPIVNPNLSVLKKTGYGVDRAKEKQRIDKMKEQYRMASKAVDDWYNSAPMEEDYSNPAEFNAALDAFNKTAGQIKQASKEKSRIASELRELGVDF